MMYYTDKPIKKAEHDLLGRAKFANDLAKTIMGFKTKDNYVISLQGSWGSGKTSVLNMVTEKIEAMNENLEEQNRVIIVQFNPWNFTDTNQLIYQFFSTLSNELKLKNRQKTIKAIGSNIETYSSALAYTEYIPFVGPYLKFVPSIFTNIGKFMKKNAESNLYDVAFQKQKVETSLLKLESRILVVIDDLDRLSNTDIRLIFQLVNNIAGFPNVTYLLSFDKDIVVRALEKVQNCDGQEYLEKFIQMPFDLPPLNISRVHKIFFEKINNLKSDYTDDAFDSQRWLDVFSYCISPFLKTLRDVNRFNNAFAFKYPLVKDEVDFIDMAGLCALQIFAAPIAEWIRNNKFSLVGDYSNRSKSANDAIEKKNELLVYFGEVYPKNPTIMLNAITTLFPKYYDKITYSAFLPSLGEIHHAKRLASESLFDIYFSLSLENIKISRKEFDNSIKSKAENEFQSYLNKLNEQNIFVDYLREIELHKDVIPLERIEMILKVLLLESGKNIEEGFVGAGSPTIQVNLISDLLFRFSDENMRFNALANMFLNTDYPSFQLLLYLFQRMELTHGKMAETTYRSHPKLVEKENLEALEIILIERIKTLIFDNSLYDWTEFRRAALLWAFLEEATYTEYINSTISKELNSIKFLSIHVNDWYSGNVIKRFDLTNVSYTKFVSKDEIITLINDSRWMKEFWELKSRFSEVAAAFVLSIEQPDRNNIVDAAEAKQKLEKWRKAFWELEQLEIN